MNTNSTQGLLAKCEPANGQVTTAQLADVVAAACLLDAYRGKRVLVIVPDGTRTAPVGVVFKTLHAHLGDVIRQAGCLDRAGHASADE
jgi:lactate racemase